MTKVEFAHILQQWWYHIRYRYIDHLRNRK